MSTVLSALNPFKAPKLPNFPASPTPPSTPTRATVLSEGPRATNPFTSLISTAAGGLARKADTKKRTLLGG